VSQKPNRRRVARSGLAGDWGNAMARRRSVLVRRGTSAPAATLFRIETDGANWSQWAKPLVLQSEWEREDQPPPAGLGAIRKLGIWPMLGREEIIYEQDLRHVYALVGGAASWARDYQGEVTFRQDPSGGTEVRWRASFVPTIPGTGWLVSAARRAMVWFFAMRLARAAEVEWSRFSGRC
jgi:hypothetical protein